MGVLHVQRHSSSTSHPACQEASRNRAKQSFSIGKQGWYYDTAKINWGNLVSAIWYYYDTTMVLLWVTPCFHNFQKMTTRNQHDYYDTTILCNINLLPQQEQHRLFSITAKRKMTNRWSTGDPNETQKTNHLLTLLPIFCLPSMEHMVDDGWEWWRMIENGCCIYYETNPSQTQQEGGSGSIKVQKTV